MTSCRRGASKRTFPRGSVGTRTNPFLAFSLSLFQRYCPPAPPSQRGEGSGFLIALAILLFTGFTTSLRADDRSAPTYERDIKPLFAKNCTVCHRATKRNNPDISGGLALDSYEAILTGTARAKVLVPGRAAASELARAAGRCG